MIRRLVKQVDGKHDSWTLVGKNGFMVGIILWHRCKVKPKKLAFAFINHYEGESRKEVVFKGVFGDVGGDGLIIDDIVETGETIKELRRNLGDMSVACLIRKDYDVFKVDYSVLRVPMWKWVEWPWEM